MAFFANLRVEHCRINGFINLYTFFTYVFFITAKVRQISHPNPQHLTHGSNQYLLHFADRKIRIPPGRPIKRVLTPISDGLSKLYIQLYMQSVLFKFD